MYAMKYMNKIQIIAKHAVENVFREQELLSALEHAFLVNLWFTFHDAEDIFMVMDLMLGELSCLPYNVVVCIHHLHINQFPPPIPLNQTQQQIKPMLCALCFTLHLNRRGFKLSPDTRGKVHCASSGTVRGRDGTGVRILAEQADYSQVSILFYILSKGRCCTLAPPISVHPLNTLFQGYEAS